MNCLTSGLAERADAPAPDVTPRALLERIVDVFAAHWPHSAYARQARSDTVTAHYFALTDATTEEIAIAGRRALKEWARWEAPQLLRQLVVDNRKRTAPKARPPVVPTEGTEHWRTWACVWCRGLREHDGSVIHAPDCVRQTVRQESAVLTARRALHLPLEGALDAEQEAKLAELLVASAPEDGR